MKITADTMYYRELNELINKLPDKNITIDKAFGQRYIGCGLSEKKIVINGTPGNALGAYLDGASILVNGNAQDAVGDTMNEGEIVIKGSGGDAIGYAMRGGKILVKGNVGYRAGIHMKAYEDKTPVLIIGGCAGSFLGEYQAGGTIIVLGIGKDSGAPVGYFCGNGMHGGKIIIRSDIKPVGLAEQLCCNDATDADKEEIKKYVDMYCKYFGEDEEKLLGDHFFVITPNSKNPYKRLYTQN